MLSVRRLPSERRLSAVSTLDMVSTAIAFSLLNTTAAVALQGLFGGGVSPQTDRQVEKQRCPSEGE